MAQNWCDRDRATWLDVSLSFWAILKFGPFWSSNLKMAQNEREKIFGPFWSLNEYPVTWPYLRHSRFGPFWGISRTCRNWWTVKLRTGKPDDKTSEFLHLADILHFSRYETPKNQVATPVHQEKRKNQKRSPKIESKDDQPIRENLEKNSVKNLSVKQIKEICDKNLQVRYNRFV